MAEPAATGWTARPSALLLYDSSGTLVSEQALGSWDETTDTRLIIHETRGGGAKSGRFAWTWDMKTVWNLPHTQRLEQRSVFNYFGPSGKELWDASNAAAPKNSDPVALSENGEALLLSQRSEGGFTVAVKTYIGNTLWEVGPFPSLQSIELTANGRYAVLRWSEPDKASTHTFLSIADKTRKDIPSSELHLGKAVIDESGAVLSGGKKVFSF